MTKKHEMEVPAKDLDAGGKSYDFVVRPTWLLGVLEGTEATPKGPDGSFDVRCSKSGDDVVVRGKLHVDLVVPCARCLDPVALPIDQEISALMVPAKKLGGAQGKDEDEEYELTADEADTLPYDGETVVLDDLVRDEIVLEIPMIPLCSEDCPGMNTSPEEQVVEPAQKPVDPRLAVLKNFKPSKA